MQEDLVKDKGHSSILVQRKSGIPSVKIVHKVNGTKWLKNDDISRKRTPSLPCSKSIVQRSHHKKKKSHGKLSIHYCADLESAETIFEKLLL